MCMATHFEDKYRARLEALGIADPSKNSQHEHYLAIFATGTIILIPLIIALANYVGNTRIGN